MCCKCTVKRSFQTLHSYMREEVLQSMRLKTGKQLKKKNQWNQLFLGKDQIDKPLARLMKKNIEKYDSHYSF